MKTTIWLLLALGILIYSSEPTISFKPFSIEFGRPYIPFAVFFLVLSLVLFQIQNRRDVKREVIQEYYPLGWKDGKEYTIKRIKEEIHSRDLKNKNTNSKPQ